MTIKTVFIVITQQMVSGVTIGLHTNDCSDKRSKIGINRFGSFPIASVRSVTAIQSHNATLTGSLSSSSISKRWAQPSASHQPDDASHQPDEASHQPQQQDVPSSTFGRTVVQHEVSTVMTVNKTHWVLNVRAWAWRTSTVTQHWLSLLNHPTIAVLIPDQHLFIWLHTHWDGRQRVRWPVIKYPQQKHTRRTGAQQLMRRQRQQSLLLQSPLPRSTSTASGLSYDARCQHENATHLSCHHVIIIALITRPGRAAAKNGHHCQLQRIERWQSSCQTAAFVIRHNSSRSPLMKPTISVSETTKTIVPPPGCILV